MARCVRLDPYSLVTRIELWLLAAPTSDNIQGTSCRSTYIKVGQSGLSAEIRHQLAPIAFAKEARLLVSANQRREFVSLISQTFADILAKSGRSRRVSITQIEELF